MEFLRLLESVRVPALDAFFSAVTYLGDELAFMALALLLFWCVDKRTGYYVFVVGLFGTLANQFLKILCRVPRPWVLDPGFTIVESARAAATGYSFPSGHTQNAVGTFGAIGLSAKRRWVNIACLALVLLVPFSRMYLGVHTPLDVGAAFLMAAILLAAFYPIFRSEEKTKGAMAVSSRGGHCACHRIRLLCQRHPRRLCPRARRMRAILAHAVKNAGTLLGAIAGLLTVFLVDRKTLRFETHAPLLGQILKFVLGLALVAGIKAALKPLFYAVLPSGLADCLRYYLVVLLAGVVWPRTFSFWAKLGAKKEA